MSNAEQCSLKANLEISTLPREAEKTTLLATKLMLLGRKWNDERRGICVLSHTNVAREEIQRRLGASAEGSRLLTHPHFIGTIHGLVNHFLAVPYLRSNGLEVDVIDNEIFSQRALAKAKSNWSLRTWMEQNVGVQPMVEGLIFKGPNLELTSEGGRLPSEKAKTFPILQNIKRELAKSGVFRHADMFAFAEQHLEVSPRLKKLMSQRFPLVFIDEMQDTSWDQERLLQLIFDDTVIIQRLGDINQRILVSEDGAKNLSFPNADALPISTSKRFGPTIAQVVASAQLSGVAVAGTGLDAHAPMLLIYPTEKVDKVISAFGVEVLKRFDDATIHAGPVKALCARKQGDAKKAIAGRTLLDYWPALAQSPASGKQLGRFWSLVTGAGPQTKETSLMGRADEIRRALLLVLREAKSQAVANVTGGHQLLRKLSEAGIDVVLKANECTVEHEGRSLCVHIGSVASMKGETHLATLVLESLGHPSRRFDIQEALPVTGGLKERDKKISDGLLSQFRNLYVGLSRPTSFLCLAVNAERVSEECKSALINRGWVISAVE
ncbi:hypothetical protein L1887_40579 [Cichorium endivia]|nr:hypothetical protein L1887_40579 [Cichorium endivia]